VALPKRKDTEDETENPRKGSVYSGEYHAPSQHRLQPASTGLPNTRDARVNESRHGVWTAFVCCERCLEARDKKEGNQMTENHLAKDVPVGRFGNWARRAYEPQGQARTHLRRVSRRITRRPSITRLHLVETTRPLSSSGDRNETDPWLVEELDERCLDGLKELSTIGSFISSPEQALGLLRDGQRCFVCISDGEIIGCTWAKCRTYHDEYLNYTLDLGSDVYIYGAYVVPEYRGREVLRAILEFIAEALSTNDDRTIDAVAIIRRENVSSKRAFAKIGMLPATPIILVELLFGLRMQFMGAGSRPSKYNRRFRLDLAPSWI
jgi:hypothetical protein